jgi:hypothetical protein
MTTQSTIRVSASLLVIVLIAIGTPAVAAETVPQPKDKASIETQSVGVFTGAFVNGMPVYRLPPVSVVAHRKVEEARMAREEREARVKQARAKAAGRPPA